MSEPTVVQTIVPHLTELAIAVITAVVAYVSSSLSSLIKAKTQSTKLETMARRLSDAVYTAVMELSQTTKGILLKASADGKLRPEDAAALKNMAFERVKDLLTEAGWIALVTASGGERAARGIIEAKIESAVLETRGMADRALAKPN